MAEKTFTVRAAGADTLFSKHLLAKFPDKVPNLKASGKDAWKLKREEIATDGGKEWALEQVKGGSEKYKGIQDVGLSGAGASNYFILIRQKGSENEFLAVPADDLCTFKKVLNRKDISLEDAEAQMKHQRQKADKVNPRLAQALGPSEGEEVAAPKDEEEADSDEEWKDIKARAATRTAAAATAPGRKPPAPHPNLHMDDEDDREQASYLPGGGDEFVPRPQGAEDWEHEDDRADDDLDMGHDEGDEDEDGEGMGPGGGVGRRSPSVSDDDEGDVAPQKVHKALKRMLRQSGLEGGEYSQDEEGEDESSDEDSEDLDKMAEEVLPGFGEEAFTIQPKKRKSPPVETEEAQTGGASGSGPPAKQAKRAKVAEAAPVPASPGKPGLGECPVSEREVVELLLAHNRLPLSFITSHFKARLPTSAEKKAFAAMVKRVAKLEPAPGPDGQRYLVLL